MSLPMMGAGLLLIGGLMHALPLISSDIKRFLWGQPIVQIIIGMVSVTMGIGIMTKLI